VATEGAANTGTADYVDTWWLAHVLCIVSCCDAQWYASGGAHPARTDQTWALCTLPLTGLRRLRSPYSRSARRLLRGPPILRFVGSAYSEDWQEVRTYLPDTVTFTWTGSIL
jgi:hypothetical protein